MAPSDTYRWRLDSDGSNTSETYFCVSSLVDVNVAKVNNSQNRHAYSNVPLFETHSVFRDPEGDFIHGFPSINAASPLCHVYSVDDGEQYQDKENYPFTTKSTLRKETDDVVCLTDPLYEIEGMGYILPCYNRSCTSFNCVEY